MKLRIISSLAALTLAVSRLLAADDATLQRALADAMITEMTATGGLMIAGIGLMLLGIKRLPLANYPPGLIIAPPLVACLR